ncbi:MAG: hypothetical protein ACK4SV_05885 [Hyphomonas sp.]
MFRDFSMIIQKSVNLRYRDGTPVENIAGEGVGVPEDAHDAGAAAINFGTEPLWFRFGFGAGADWGFGDETGPGLASIPNAFRAYANAQGGNSDPATPVYLARPGDQVRFRITKPTGYARNTTMAILGHNWTEEPFISVNMPSDVMAKTAFQVYRSTVDNIVTGNGWNVVTEAGGPFRAPGDYLFRDIGSFGNLNGLWGIFRVEEDNPIP